MRTGVRGAEAAGFGVRKEGGGDAVADHEVAFPVVGLPGPAVVGEDAQDLAGCGGIGARSLKPFLGVLLGLLSRTAHRLFPGSACHLGHLLTVQPHQDVYEGDRPSVP